MGIEQERTYPLISSTSIDELNPTVHWAQEHLREHGFVISRQIYDFQLLYVKAGEIKLRLGANGTAMTLTNGQLVLLPAGMYHHYVIVSEPGAVFLGIHFDFYNEVDLRTDEDLVVSLPVTAAQESRFCKLPHLDELGGKLPYLYPAPPLQTVAVMELVIQEFSHKRPGYELACKGMMLTIISQLYRHSQHPRIEVAKAYEDGIRAAAREIEQHCSEDWSNARIAALLNVNEDYMARLFRSTMGMSPNRYVQWVRHQGAKERLRNTEDKLELIGKSVGYEDTAYFCRVFKKWEGMTAETYRKYSRIL
ncbi:helix-turn-helix domain-containing protein [Paenibacillus sp. GCM10023252]|uniref:AraC family transcriptional regulator n=1 Tax=Paenibacillus sp. GCM10023252 TaxID=3252649 RepID=UPI003615D9EA